jgi:hypothetical protein
MMVIRRLSDLGYKGCGVFLVSGEGAMKLEEKELEKPIRAWIGIDWPDENMT